jgi:quinoprotein glucose dehydrogenase
VVPPNSVARPRRARATLPVLVAALGLLLGCPGEREATITAETASGRARDWPHYAGDAGGRHFSPLADITPDNVTRLRKAWTYRTGDLPGPEVAGEIASEVTPLLVDETLYLCTPFNRVIALDPETGAERWSYDPEVDTGVRYANQMVCRGVAAWRDPDAPATQPCARRIFTATNDARLIALDRATGRPCEGFGDRGQVRLSTAVGALVWPGEYQVTSPPVVGHDLVVVGSAVSDNLRTDAPSGVVRAFDAGTGALRWAWDLRPPGFLATPENTSDEGYALGTPNVWAPMSVDLERDLLFVPTGNPAPDYYRDEASNRALDHYGSSVVALRLSSGEVVWSFQTVHHDVWDLDVPAQPTLFELRRGDERIPALVQGTKMGLLFVLHRETGEPLFPVEERPVPQAGVPGQILSATQPYPVRPPQLVPSRLAPEQAFGLTPWDRGRCRDRLAASRSEGTYTPPSLQGSVLFPGNSGGINWGGVAVDEEHQRLVTNVTTLPWSIRLIPRDDPEVRELAGEVGEMKGTPYVLHREVLLSPLGLPCNPPPWGEVLAVDLGSGEVRWRTPLGTVRDLAPFPLPPIRLGVPTLGGSLLTGGGLVFIGATLDHYLRAFDAETGTELWRARLPASGNASPMSYRVRDGGRQYVVIAATGYGRSGGKVSDAIVAFALEP